MDPTYKHVLVIHDEPAIGEVLLKRFEFVACRSHSNIVCGQSSGADVGVEG
jgi:hypothetical protein